MVRFCRQDGRMTGWIEVFYIHHCQFSNASAYETKTEAKLVTFLGPCNRNFLKCQNLNHFRNFNLVSRKDRTMIVKTFLQGCAYSTSYAITVGSYCYLFYFLKRYPLPILQGLNSRTSTKILSLIIHLSFKSCSSIVSITF